jgi:surface polysaccharide O-acyltransferase-like enzyme
MVAGYVGYFVLGHFLHQRESGKKERGVIYALGAAGAVATVVFTYLFSKRTGALDMSFYNNMALGVMLESAALFVFIKYHTPQNKNGMFSKLIQTAAVCSFGIFLVHLLVLRLVPKFIHFELYTIPLVISIPIYAVAVFLVSFLIAFILKKIPFINRYIV